MKWLYISRIAYCAALCVAVFGAMVLDGPRLAVLCAFACIGGGLLLGREFILLRKVQARSPRAWDALRVAATERETVSVPIVIDQSARQVELITAQQRAMLDDVVQLYAIARAHGGLVTRAYWRGRAKRYGDALAFCKQHRVFVQEGRAHRLTMKGREFCDWLQAVAATTPALLPEAGAGE